MSIVTDLPWIESPWWRDELVVRVPDQTTRSLAEAFGRDGYVVLDEHIADIERIAAGLRRSLEPELHVQARVQDAWRTIPEARELALQPSVLDLLGQLYGRAAVPFQTLHFRRGSEQAAHSDALHFHSLPHRYLCGVWVALEDISPDSGPLCVYPGSHRFPVWELQDMGLTPGPTAHHAAEAFVQRWVQEHELRKEVVCLKKGQAILWAANLLHAGEPIQDSTHTRWSQVTHYFFEDCLYFNPLRSDPSMGQMQLRKVVDIRTGQEVPHVYRGRRYQPTSEQMFWMQPSLMAFLRAVGVRIAVAVKQVLHQ